MKQNCYTIPVAVCDHVGDSDESMCRKTDAGDITVCAALDAVKFRHVHIFGQSERTQPLSQPIGAGNAANSTIIEQLGSIQNSTHDHLIVCLSFLHGVPPKYPHIRFCRDADTNAGVCEVIPESTRTFHR